MDDLDRHFSECMKREGFKKEWEALEREEAILKFAQEEQAKHYEDNEVISDEAIKGYIIGLTKFANSIGKTLSLSFNWHANDNAI